MTDADGRMVRGVDDDYDSSSDRGSGWLFFAGTVLGIAGIMRILDAIWAFRSDGVLEDGLVGEKLENYGWLWLFVGVLLLLSSFAVLSRSQFGRWIGIIAAAVGTISAVAWMPYYPVWALIYVALGVFVIYALAVYGGRERY
jgi:hypothetical protein